MYVEDDRLQTESSGKEVDDICYKVASDGGGSYLKLNTFPFGGFGQKVSEETIFNFMRRYGIDPSEIHK